MKNNSTMKKIIMGMLIVAVIMLVVSFRAVYAVLDIDTGGVFQSIDDNTEPKSTPVVETTKNNVVENNVVQNNTTNKSSSTANESKLPATGSNTEIIFVVAVATLVGIGAVIYKKANIKLD